MVRVNQQRIQLPASLQGMPGMEQLQQQLEQLAQIPGLEDLESLLGGGNLEGLGGDTAAQFFQNLAQQASARAGARQGQSLLGDQQFQTQAAGNNSGNVDPLAQNSLARPSRIGDSNNVDAQLAAMAEVGGGGGYFEDRIFAIMCKVVEDMQKKIEERLTKLQNDAKAAEGNSEDKGGESRNIEFEKIKFDMQKLSQMQQAMSNVLNSMDELAKSAIRKIQAN